MRLGRREDELHVRRRLFERLEEGVESRRSTACGLRRCSISCTARGRGCRLALALSSRTSSTELWLAPSISMTSTSSPVSTPQAHLALDCRGSAVGPFDAVERLGKDARHRGLAGPARAREYVRLRDAARLPPPSGASSVMCDWPTTSSNVRGLYLRDRTWYAMLRRLPCEQIITVAAHLCRPSPSPGPSMAACSGRALPST